MNSELLKFIKDLSEKDSKNLTGKGFKATEELGELAKAILPYESASGTLHRFVHRKQILENAVDLMLCAYSIAYDLKYTDQDIEDMLKEKSIKWAGIQAKEGKVNYPLPFEIHVTVDALMDEKSIEIFKQTCAEIKVKPIIIDLEKDGKIVMKDAMTSSVHFGNNASAIKAAHEVANHFRINGYDVLRVKIETVPWHPAAPSKTDPEFVMPKDCYFESHLRIITNKESRPVLEKIANSYEAHLSRNFFKRINDTDYIIMMTLRDYKIVSETFKNKVENLKKVLTDAGFIVDKTEIEFAVFDTNVTHDIEWIRD